MASFVEIDASNIVIRGVVLDDKDTQDESGDEVESVGAKYLNEGFGGTWKKTSYNRNIRKNYAGIGFTFDSVRDAFYAPQPYPSWILDEDICQWDPPVERPDNVYDENAKLITQYKWNEDIGAWDEK